MAALLLHLPSSAHRHLPPLRLSNPTNLDLAPTKISSFSTSSINFSGDTSALLNQLLRPLFPQKTTPFSPRYAVRAKQDSDGAASYTHFIKRHARELAVVLVGSLAMLFVGIYWKRALWAQGVAKTAKSSSLPATERRDGDEDEVVDGYLRVLERDPRDVEALKMVVYGKMRAGKTKEAVEYVERLIEVEPEEMEWRLLQALSYELMGQLSKAKRLFKEILEERPLLIKALHGLAMVMQKTHEGPAVFDMLNGALELAHREQRVTEERNIRILIGQMLLVQGELDEALKHFQDLVNKDPRDFRPYLCQGIIYSLLEKSKEAEEQFENYRSFVPEEFPNRGFLDDVVKIAKTASIKQLQEEFTDEFSYGKQ